MTIYRIISAEKARIAVSWACDVLGVSTSGFYDWERRAPSDRALSDAWLTKKIKTIWAENREVYGANRVRAELLHGRGIKVGHNAVELIMRELGIKGLPTRRLPKGSRLGKVTSLDLVGRKFRREGPDLLWVADFERHEALCDRVGVRDLRGPPVTAGG